MLFFLVCYIMFSMESIEFTHTGKCACIPTLYSTGFPRSKHANTSGLLFYLIKCGETKAMACTLSKYSAHI